MSKKTPKQNLEILSPAGSPEGFFAGLNSGADAIYLGVSNFNARMKAENFTLNNIREYVKLAHLFGVKVYVTINTLLEDSDFAELIDIVKQLAKAKVDAFIVQDLGVFYLLSKCFKNIVIHTSTQMGVHNVLGASVAEQLGASRVVLSRETKLQDIKEIKNKTGLEIEYFVQGALCVAFSGNCYLSALEKNMSGNEGKCLQLCRLPYSTNEIKEPAYLLSARDLCLIDNLPELISAGVSSFKIEGRLRHAGYTATATNAYKKALECAINHLKNERQMAKLKNNLRVCFSRGSYNERAYLDDGNPDSIIFKDYQNHIGKKIGMVKSVEPFKNNLYKVIIKSSHELSAGDGLKIIDEKTKKQIASLGVGNSEKLNNGDYVFYTKNKFPAGLSVHLTQDSKSETELLANKKKIDISFEIKAFQGKPFEVVCKSQTAGCFVESDFILQEAKTTPLYEEDIIAQFSKFRDTNFELKNISVQTDFVFLPKSELNKLRRLCIEKLEESIISQNEKNINVEFDEQAYTSIKNQKTKSSPCNILIFDKDSIPDKKSNTLLVYKPDVYNIDDIKSMRETIGENFALALPTILNYEDEKYLSSILNNLPNISIFVNNIYGLSYASKGFKVVASPLMNIKNSYAIKCLNSLGIDTICASIESNIEYSKKYNLITFETGAFPVMTFAHCPYKTINENTCKNCSYKKGLKIIANDNKSYQVSRTKLKTCQFEMNKTIINTKQKFSIKNLKI